MSTFEAYPRASVVSVDEQELNVRLADGRTVSVPLAWFPRLLNAKSDERQNFRLIGGGEGIHWPDIDELECCWSVSGLAFSSDHYKEVSQVHLTQAYVAGSTQSRFRGVSTCTTARSLL